LKTFERTTAAVSTECSLVWDTADAEQTDEWRRRFFAIVSMQRVVMLNVCCNNGCNMFNVFTSNGWTFHGVL